ncbi:MAG: hypothetical protein AB7G93_16000 [Bdellovibrionales bacterium]
MLRVLMVLEDYGEMVFLQTVLKKVGFDVDAIQNPRLFNDSLLTMNPEVLVMTANGRRVRGYDLSRTLKRVRGLPHIVLIRGHGQPELTDPEVGAWLESPVNPLDLLNAIADFCGLNKEVLAEKFSKLQMHEPSSEDTRILKMDAPAGETMQKSPDFGGDKPGRFHESALTPAQRRERFSKFLTGPRPANHGYSVKQVQEQVKALRQAESSQDLGELERQRKAFVEHLFRKKT